MISYVEGRVLYTETSHVVVNVSGVGYHVLLGKKAMEEISDGQTIALFIHTHLREDSLELYGFFSRTEKQIFLLLIGVSGIGPKLAQSILSVLSPAEVIRAIIDKDINMMTSIPGIGKKTAERLSLELKEKADKIDMTSGIGHSCRNLRTNLEMAIRGLGYSKTQSEHAILKLDQDDLKNLPLEALIKKTINVLTGNVP